VLNAFPRLQLRIDLGRRRRCEVLVSDVVHAEGGIRLPAAATASCVLRFSSGFGLWDPLASGLRLLLDSVCLEDGDRDRRSNLEALRGSGSVWSKRERLRGASSDMAPHS